jgi:hypothetical protein
MLIDSIFPFWYIALLLGFLIGIGITFAVVGVLSAGAIFLAGCLGMFRIMPLIEFCSKIFTVMFHTHVEKFRYNIKESFKLRHNLEEGKYIYMWHPHGVFATSQFLHIGSELTSWPKKNISIQGTAFHGLLWLPFVSEIFQHFGAVPTEYHAMKKVLIDGSSLSVCPGGMREMLPIYNNDMRVLLKKRRGIFKMALETGTPLVPVVSFGENELYKCIEIPAWIQNALEPYDMCIPIPTIGSVMKWFGLLSNPLKDPIMTVVGEPVLVKKIESPTDADIIELRERYIESLKQMYKKERTDTSELKIE